MANEVVAEEGCFIKDAGAEASTEMSNPSINSEEVISWPTKHFGEHDDAYVRFLRKYYMPLIVKYHWHLLFMWFIVLIICGVFGPAFLNSTKSNLDLPKGTPSAEAIETFSANYPSLNSWPPAFIISKSQTSQSVLQPRSEAAAGLLADYTKKYPKTVYSVAGYYSYSAIGLQALAQRQVSDDLSTSITTVSFQKDTTLAAIYDVCDDLLAWSKQYSEPALQVYTTGIFPLFSEMQKQTSIDFALIDEIVLPICIAILGISLKSYRHMAIALLNLILTILLAFGILMPITTAVDINPFSPSILMSLGIAVCFDYSLFMLTRFKEERLYVGRSKEDAVFHTLVNSGHVVLLSGATLFTTFILLLIFPQNFLQSVGYVCSIVTLSAMIVNMSVTPALLLACDCFSHFDLLCFTKPHTSLCCLLPPRTLSPIEAAELRENDMKARAAVKGNWLTRALYSIFGGNVQDASVQAGSLIGNQKVGDSSLPPANTLTNTADNEASNTTPEAEKQKEKLPGRNFWFQISYFCTKHAKLVLIVMCGITIPFLITFVNFTPTSDDYLIYLQSSRSLEGLKIMKSSFNEGRLEPYMIIITTGTANAALTQSYFSTESAVVSYLLSDQTEYLGKDGITCLTYFQGTSLSLSQALSYMDASTADGQTATGLAYRLFAGSLLNGDYSSSLIRLELKVPPRSQVTVPFIKSLRTKLKDFTNAAPVTGFNVKMFLFGGYTTTLDVQDSLFSLVPIMIAVTIVIVLVMIGISFGSVLLALRLAFTVFISLCWTYGLMVLVYQPGPSQRDFAVLTPSILSSSGIYWLIPIMSFSILVGLALDYDIFLMSRVVEFRRLGWSDRASVCLAIEKTAGIITAAGCIMSISFAGLLIPKTLVLNQYGFSLFLGVAFDTFVVRTVLVPSVITALGESRQGLASKLNWWPSVMPDLAYDTAEEEHDALMRGLWVPEYKKGYRAYTHGADYEESKTDSNNSTKDSSLVVFKDVEAEHVAL